MKELSKENCKRCNGLGKGNWYADRGRCWECSGTGVVDYVHDVTPIAQFYVCMVMELDGATKQRICSDVRNRGILSDSVNKCLENLVRVGYVKQDGKIYSLTKFGKERLEKRLEEKRKEAAKILNMV